MTTDEAKAFLYHYAKTTKPATTGTVVARAQPVTAIIDTAADSLSDLESIDIIKLKAMKAMTIEGYTLYTPEEHRLIQSHHSLVDLYNAVQGSSLWESVSKKGTLRVNSVRYQRIIKEKGPN